uniref:Putative secreted protein n=1 Tax=Ixodes ricinus TaxID=34613 RepID=A0A6B0U303_IXORI
MSLLKVIYLSIALLISPYYTNSFPDFPGTYVTQKCIEEAKKFGVPKFPAGVQQCSFLQVSKPSGFERYAIPSLGFDNTPHWKVNLPDRSTLVQ